MKRLENKVALITGAASGMGLATARRFMAEGARVMIGDLKQSAVDAAVHALSTDSAMVRGLVLDVSDEESVARVVDQTVAQFGHLDIVVNNAGIGGSTKVTDQLSATEWDQVFNVDVKGVFFVTKHAIPYLRQNGGGSIVNFSSVFGMRAVQGNTAYATAKAAVTALTSQDALTYGPDHIRVNSVHPGTIKTPMVAAVPQDVLEALKRKHPIGYIGEPEDVANAVLFLASDEARFITGAHLTVDGGYTLQ